MAMLNGLKNLNSTIVQIKLNILGLCSEQIFKNGTTIFRGKSVRGTGIRGKFLVER